MVYIGGGVLYPSQLGGKAWHWISEDDTAIPLAYPNFATAPEYVSIGGREIIRIGTARLGSISTNADCPLDSFQGDQFLRRLSINHAKSLQAFASHWQFDSIQGGFQGGQYIGPQVMLGWRKTPGHTEKQNLVNPSNKTLLPELSSFYGLQLSLCTGLMYRVPLQVLIGDRILSYIQSRGPLVEEWLRLHQYWQITRAFRESNLEEWFHNLPSGLHTAVWMLVKEILNQIQHTGIDHENMLRLAWVQPSKALKCLKIKCSGANSWVKILTDSPDVVTFASISPKCAQTPWCKCSGTLPESYDLHRPLLLYTQVRPLCEDHEAVGISGDWTLQPGKNYWICPKDLMMLASANSEDGIMQLSVRKSAMPAHLLRRKANIVRLRETNDEGAVECLVGGPESFAREEAGDRTTLSTAPITTATSPAQSSPLIIRTIASTSRVA